MRRKPCTGFRCVRSPRSRGPAVEDRQRESPGLTVQVEGTSAGALRTGATGIAEDIGASAAPGEGLSEGPCVGVCSGESCNA